MQNPNTDSWYNLKSISLDSILLNDSLKMLIAHHRQFSNDISATECHGDIFPFIILEQEKCIT